MTEPALQTPIDWTMLDSITGANRQSAEEMLRDFRSVMPEYRDALERALAGEVLASRDLTL